ncbi:hypothetical protein BG005_011023 [Podila minutissima]|nr:hypothetical protein BG005_011023 [Podila minutissima]
MAQASSNLTAITYNVVGFPGTEAGSFGVMINEKITNLSTTPETFPLWSATITGASAPSGYRYVELSDQDTIVQQEPFSRSFQNGSANHTANEFFLRQVTKTSLPDIPQAFEGVRPAPSKAFDDSQIATIHLTPKPNDFADMVAAPRSSTNSIEAGFRFISADTVYSVKKVKVKVSGRDTRGFKKLSLRIKFRNGDTFFDRPIIKVRSGVFDPTMIREKLYIDVLNAVGVRNTEGAWIRVYVNGKPYGFYLMVEDIELPFLRRTIHHGDAMPRELGSLYKMANLRNPNEEATMKYVGPRTADYKPKSRLDEEEIYENQNLGANREEEPMAQLIAFFKDLRDYDPKLSGGVEFWNSRLDLEGFLRCMAMEYLGGNWDAYWLSGNNYFMYFNPTESKWQFIPTDFDRTFGGGKIEDGKPRNMVTAYKKFADHKSANDYPLVNKLIYMNNEINARFEQILLHIVNKVLNSEVLESRIKVYEKMIEDEAKWDYSLDRSTNEGKPVNFTIDDFRSGISSVENVNIGIKPWIKGRAEDVPAWLQSTMSFTCSSL